MSCSGCAARRARLKKWAAVAAERAKHVFKKKCVDDNSKPAHEPGAAQKAER